MPQLPYSMGEGCPGDEGSVRASIPCGMGGNMKDLIIAFIIGVIVGSSIFFYAEHIRRLGRVEQRVETISKDIDRIMMRMGPLPEAKRK